MNTNHDALRKALEACDVPDQYRHAIIDKFTALSQPMPEAAAHGLLDQIRKLPTIKAPEIDGEEADGTPRYWRSRPYVSLTQLERLLSASPAAPEVAKHPDDEAVDRFAQAMKEKLAAAREKGRGGWQTCSREDLSWMLRDHVAKGDPRDVANFCMFLWNLGYGISQPTDAENAERAVYSDAPPPAPQPQAQGEPYLPPLPEGKAVVRGPAAAFNDPECGTLVDFDCEGPLSHCPDGGEELFTADQVLVYGSECVQSHREALAQHRAALRQIAEMPGHATTAMRQLAGDSIGMAPLGDRECHGCMNGDGGHSTSCTKHSDKTPNRLKGAQWTWSAEHGKWVRIDAAITEAERVPLTDEQAEQLRKQWMYGEDFRLGPFMAGLRAAEAAHHIGKPAPAGINGLTEAETAASASVMGLTRKDGS
ncbi:MAG: hypothetical protein K2Y15_12455 [Burkholderiaceae bacterium]|nr:hypothetical protein [Burkholderiaceae bacterium]